MPGGVDLAPDGTPILYVGTVQQMGIPRDDGTAVAPIDSYTESTPIETNDRIRLGDFAFNVGVLLSEDVLYGQGLRHAPGTVSDYALAPSAKYKMYMIGWLEMIQPRLGLTWTYHDGDTVFANFARYGELARAGGVVGPEHAGESGCPVRRNRAHHLPRTAPGFVRKVFAPGLTPRRINEWTFGTTRALPGGLLVRAYLRRREGSHFWEDTWNGSRGYDNAPAHIAAKGPYVPNLDAVRAQIGGSSYVIAELDDAYTEYWEAAVELEWRGERRALNASYLRSRYTGNFDQDNTSSNNDANLFIASSDLADGYGRQLWDNKDGVLRGDRTHVLKAFGHLDLPWRASIGALLFYQSGQPWEAWDATAYGLPTYFSSTIRYAERAGSRRSPSRWQLDRSYTQRFSLVAAIEARLRVDLFNVFDRQTGYDIDPLVRNATFGQPRSRFDPRRLQVSVGMEI